MSDLRNQRVAVTKRLLQEGLLRLLEDKEHYPDLSHITVTALCKESGVNRTTFYTHYHTPEDILAEIGKDMADDFVRREQKKYPDGKHDNHAVLTDLCRYLYVNADKVRILIRFHRDDDMKKAFPKMLKENTPVTAFLRSHFNEREMPLAATFLSSGIYALVRSWLVDDLSMSPEEVAALIEKIAGTNWTGIGI